MNAFEPSSGQIFTEIIVKARCKQYLDGPKWYHSSRGTRLEHLSSHIIPPTLETLALRTLLRNLSFVEDGALRNLPLLLAQRCWDQVKRK